MSHPCRLFLGVLIAAILATAIGCGGDSSSGASKPPGADTRAPGQYFKEQQANTTTPNGMILTDSVEEKDGKILYKTEDGKQWRVGYSKRADGTYQYGTPEETK
jgi:hypothetical protein